MPALEDKMLTSWINLFRTISRVVSNHLLSLYQVGIIIHELMHTTGFFHEQSRTDRDNYIRINWRNILPGASDQFDKYDSRSVDLLGATYDYDSIMHYGPYAFSRNGQRTIEALKAGGETMGQRKGFSATDIYKLNKLYSCDEHSNGANEERPEAGTPQPTGGPLISPVSPTRKGKSCDNKKWECYFWKWLGHCNTNKVFMLEYCLKACNWCNEGDGIDISSSGSNFAKPLATNTPKIKRCEDANGHCKKWSKTGYCNMIGYRHFMAETCAESCGKCSSNPFSFETDGIFQHNSSKPLSSAHISDYDGAANKSIYSPVLGCADSEGFKTRCQLYATWGMCHGHNKEFMEKVCPRSCNFCLVKES
ncbi:hypothetical protein M514_07738 [Trichuris suis]|uniref:Metalloendopeptidase n=1 Tax=Trichuris suis TaxID=68888 RepID=A0A085MRM0_9BILA|nr:hypothetical protein M514_07738 [Trichuris suis]KHJ40075.1 hypothetical protein D918_09868 [Trichuris suis]